MKRHFFISDDLMDLKSLEDELISDGVTGPQIHVLSRSDADVQRHKLNPVEAVLRKDVVHSMELGAVAGIIGAALVLLVTYLAGWAHSPAGWLPFIFLAIVILGFCTWEGGLFGIQEPHYQFKNFEQALRNGKHVFFVDLSELQEDLLKQVMMRHPKIQPAGEGEASPEWLIEWRNNWNGFVKSMP